MEFVFGPATPAGPALRQQNPPVLAYLPGVGALAKIIGAVLRSPTKTAAAGVVGTVVIGDYAQYLIKGVPHQGPGQDGIPGTAGIRNAANYVAGIATDTGGVPRGSQVPGDVGLLPMWRADP